MGSAVPYRQEFGTRREAWYWMLSASTPCGYSSIWFQLRTASLLVVEPPDENPSDSGAGMKSKATSSDVTPAGTSIWNAYMLTSSRFHRIERPSPWILSPTRFA